MAGDRLLGQHVEIHMFSHSLKRNVKIGNIDSASVSEKSKVLENQALFETVPYPQLLPGTWELQCKGGKINGALQAMLWDRDNHLYQGKASPRYMVTITNHYADGTSDTYAYVDGVISAFKFDATKADQEVTEDFTFTARYREARMPGAKPAKFTTNSDYGPVGSHGF